jgi:hypothetical protein
MVEGVNIIQKMAIVAHVKRGKTVAAIAKLVKLTKAKVQEVIDNEE